MRYSDDAAGSEISGSATSIGHAFSIAPVATLASGAQCLLRAHTSREAGAVPAAIVTDDEKKTQTKVARSASGRERDEDVSGASMLCER